MKKITSCLFLISWVFILFYTSCDNPSAPVLKRAKLEMRLVQEPIYIFPPDYSINTSVIISEVNGVGGNITSAELGWMEKGTVYLKNNYPGKRFRAFESWTVSDSFWLYYHYDKIRITLKGTDDNGFDFNFQKEWAIYYR